MIHIKDLIYDSFGIIDEDMIEDNEDDSEELKVLPLVAIEEGPDYVDFIKTSKSDPNHPKVKITKDLQMEWSQELAKVSKTKIYESGIFLSYNMSRNMSHISMIENDKNHKKIIKDLILIRDTKLKAR